MTKRVAAWGLVLVGALLLTSCLSRPCVLDPEGANVVNQYRDGEGHSGITGTVTLKADGRPVEAAYVNIYTDTVSNLLGPSQFLSRPTDKEGHYTLDVPPGRYYVVARKRMTGGPTGPIAPGDFFSEHQRVVTEVVAGKLSVVDLPVVAMRSPMFFKGEVVDHESDTGIRGRLVDGNGRPVPGGFAMAYHDPDMKRLPDYASTLSDADGNFTIYLPAAGTFYLAARMHAWDMPQPGEPYGRLGGEAPTGVAVAKGSFVDGITIRMAPFAGEYKAGKSRRPF